MTSVSEWLRRRGGLYGCSFCAAASREAAHGQRHSRFSLFQVSVLKRCNILRHVKSLQHVRATSSTSSSSLGGPTVEQIVSFWEHRQQGGNLQMRIDGFTIGDPKKLRKLEWCIAEAIRARFRNFLLTAGSATLTQDGRGRHLLVMLHACNKALDARTDYISLVETPGGALNLCLATIQALEEFCTPGFGRPGKPAGSPPDTVDDRLLRHVTSIIAWWFTDAAYDECVAGEMLVSSAEARAAFPSLRVVGRERAHASRRILSRPQKADEFLDGAVNKFLWSHDSIASLIQHSSTVGDVWRSAQRENEDGQAIVSMRFRRHRFDSQAEPLARMATTFDAVLRTASAVSHARKSDAPGKAAASFLQWLTAEAAIQMAMLADASDQVLTLVRTADQDTPDPAEMASFVSSFLMEGTRLWLEGRCWGYGSTKAMIAYLAKPHTYLIVEGSMASAI